MASGKGSGSGGKARRTALHRDDDDAVSAGRRGPPVSSSWSSGGSGGGVGGGGGGGGDGRRRSGSVPLLGSLPGTGVAFGGRLEFTMAASPAPHASHRGQTGQTTASFEMKVTDYQFLRLRFLLKKVSVMMIKRRRQSGELPCDVGTWHTRASALLHALFRYDWPPLLLRAFFAFFRTRRSRAAYLRRWQAMGSNVDPVEIFQHFDTNNSGEIDVREFNDGLERLGIFVTASETESLLAKFGVAGPGGRPRGITYPEFIHALGLGDADDGDSGGFGGGGGGGGSGGGWTTPGFSDDNDDDDDAHSGGGGAGGAPAWAGTESAQLTRDIAAVTHKNTMDDAELLVRYARGISWFTSLHLSAW